jgi:hypothetical protein
LQQGWWVNRRRGQKSQFQLGGKRFGEKSKLQQSGNERGQKVYFSIAGLDKKTEKPEKPENCQKIVKHFVKPGKN